MPVRRTRRTRSQALTNRTPRHGALAGQRRVHARDGLGHGRRLDVIDQGPGVAAEDVERIFEPFVQGRNKAPAPRQGSGVGLSIVRELARVLGGSVRLVSSASGAHFAVEIPDEER